MADDPFTTYDKVKNKGQSILNSIFGLPTSEDISAQKELMDYEQKLWRERAEYDSYAERMQRLRDAGLNPDLVVGQGLGSGQVPSMPSTTQVPHGSSAIPSMINSLTNASLAESQIRKNIADAGRAEAETDNTKTQTSFLSETFGVRRDLLSEQLGLKQDERKLFQQQCDTFAAYAEQAMAQVNYLRQLAMTETWNTQKAFHETRSAANAADIMHRRNLMFPQFQDLEMQKLLSEIKLNDATKRNIQQETRFLVSSFDMRLQLLGTQNSLYGAQTRYYRRQGLLGESMANYYNTFDRFLGVQMEYYPFQLISHVFNDPNYYKTDKDGNVVFGDNGMPLIRHGYQGAKVGLDIATDVVGIIKDGASAYGSIAFPQAIKGSKQGFNAVESVVPNRGFSKSSSSSQSMDKGLKDLYDAYYKAQPGSEKLRIWSRIVNYKK